GIAAIHYQVSQATSLFNVKFLCSEAATTKHRAVFAENGSGGFMSDLTFSGGAYGIQGGNQQFTAHRLTFTNVQTAIWVIWDWGWTWKSIHITGSKTGFNLTSENGKTSETGSLLVQDSIFESTTNAIVSFPPSSVAGSNNTGITLDNVVFKGVTNAIIDNKGKQWLAGSVGSVGTFVLGPVYDNLKRTFTFGTQINSPRPKGLLGSDTGLPRPIFLEHIRPQYADLPSSQFISMKKNGAKGDGDADDTAVFQSVIDRNAGTSNVIFVDAGTYVLTDTIRVPPGTRIVGELWAQLVARGPKFSNDGSPRPMLQVGTKGQVGSVEIQDLLFTNVGPTKGLINVEWNLEADKPGSAAMWDCHVRIGGATGSGLTSKECPPLKSGINPGCKAGSLMFHITSTASAYLENIWLWVGDHDLDDAQLTNANNTMPQLSVYVARGMLIESQKPTWLYGTASEHATYYQYSFYKAKNIHAGMIQTESAYYQPNPKPPLPFDSNTLSFPGDPDYKACRSNSSLSGCDSSWAVIMERSSDISFAGAGLYTWFNVYDESCVDPRTCQKSLVSLKNNGKNILFMNLVTIGAKFIATTSGGEISAQENESSSGHPKWTHLAALQISGDGSTDDEVVYIDPTIWTKPGTTLVCKGPCTLVIPPSTLPTSTTITFPPYVTTLEVGWLTGVTGGDGVVTTQFTGVTQTTTLSIPQVTVTLIDYWNVQITDSIFPANIYPTMSIIPSPFTITNSLPPEAPGTGGTRVITPPPYPWAGLTVTSSSGPVKTYIFDSTSVLVTGSTTLTYTKSGHTILFGPTSIVLDGKPMASPTTTTTSNDITFGPPLLWFTNFPTQTVSLITSDVISATTTNINGTPVPICISNRLGGIILWGFEFPGIYPGGGPPPFPKLPTPVPFDFPPKIEWPPITIGADLIPIYNKPDPDEDECKTTSVSSCFTTISQAPGTTRTSSTCGFITGCKPTETFETTTTSACALVKRAKPTGGPSKDLERRVGNCGKWGVIYPSNPKDSLANERIALEIARLRLQIEAYERPSGSAWDKQNPDTQPAARRDTGEDRLEEHATRSHLHKRIPQSQPGARREMVTLSTPLGATEDQMNGVYTYDNSAGTGQTVYVVEFGAVAHDEFSNLNIRYLYTHPRVRTTPNDTPRGEDKPGGHGTCVTAKVGGKTVGVARKAAEIVITVVNFEESLAENFLDGLLMVYDDIKEKKREKTSVVNISQQWPLKANSPKAGISQAMIAKMAVILKAMLADGVTVVTGAGNKAGAQIRGWPAKFGQSSDANHMPDLIVVGGVNNKDGNFATKHSVGRSPFPDGTTWQVNGNYDVDAWAPSEGIRCPNVLGGIDDDREGTSLAAPLVAGLAAYFKGLSTEILSPAQVKQQIQALSHSRQPGSIWPLFPPIVWNGEGGLFCANPGTRSLDPLYFAMAGNVSHLALQKRQNLPSGCSVDPVNTNPANKPTGGPTFVFETGPVPGPTCLSGCGNLCTGSVFCSVPGPNPSNPDFFDPLDPRSPQNPSNPQYTPPITTTAVPTTQPPTTTIISTTSAAPTGPSMILEIYLDSFLSEVDDHNYWYFFDARSDDSGSNAPCTTKATLRVDAPRDIKSGTQAYPNGVFNMKSHGLDCTYTGDGTKIGTLSCPGKQTTCESRLQEVECPVISNFKDTMTWEGVCYWH
ncbi:hypothetical protein IFR05_015880, partial [Cadophora sp. M221]